MDPTAIEEMFSIEDHHWWFVGKRLLVTALLDRLLRTPDLRILDVGCGTGATLAYLRVPEEARRRTVGIDCSPQALVYCVKRGLTRIGCADTTRIPFKSASFDLVLLLDVLEHVTDELALLGEIRRVLRPGGSALVSVPAYQFLWSPHDEALHHVRRYTARGLRRALEAAAFTITRLTYTNVATLLPAMLIRGLLPRLGLGRARGTDFSIQPSWLNRTLIGIYALEAAGIRRVRFPFGLSVAGIATVPAPR